MPGLMSNGVHASKIDLTCHSRAKDPEFSRFKIEPEEGVAALLDERATEIGFVTALEGGKFRVIRFTLNGSKDALQALKEHEPDQHPEASVRDVAQAPVPPDSVDEHARRSRYDAVSIVWSLRSSHGRYVLPRDHRDGDRPLHAGSRWLPPGLGLAAVRWVVLLFTQWI